MSENEGNEIKTEIKVIVLGSVAVGKTSLITRYKARKFVQNIQSTSGFNFITVNKIFNNKKYILNFWDTAGQEKYNSLVQNFIKNANIVLLIYSITDKKSFQDLDNWLKLVKKVNGEKGYSIGVIANKSDLYIQSKVDNEEGKKYAKKINAIWKLTSAFEDQKGIDGLVDQLLTNYINNEEKNEDTSTINLTPSVFPENNGGSCCEGKKKKKKDNRLKSLIDQSMISKSASEDKDSSVF